MVSLVQPLVPFATCFELFCPSQRSLMSNQLSAISLEPVTLTPRAQASAAPS